MAVQINRAAPESTGEAEHLGALNGIAYDLGIGPVETCERALFSGDIAKGGDIAEVCLETGAGEVRFSLFTCSLSGLLKAKMSLPEGLIKAENPERVNVALPASTYFVAHGRTSFYVKDGVRPNVLSLPVEEVRVRKFINLVGEN